MNLNQPWPDVKQYQIDTGRLDPRQQLRVFRSVLVWAAQRSDRFELLIEPEAYATPEEITLLCGLGKPKKLALKTGLGRLADRALGSEVIQVEGAPHERFISELCHSEAPPKSRIGFECPVESVALYTANRPLYSCYDYGAVQTVWLTDGHFEELQQQLENISVPRGILFQLKQHDGSPSND